MGLTPAIGEVEAQRLSLADEADVQVGEPDGAGEQHQQQQQLELLADLLHREPQHPLGSIPRGVVLPKVGKRALPSREGSNPDGVSTLGRSCRPPKRRRRQLEPTSFARGERRKKRLRKVPVDAAGRLLELARERSPAASCQPLKGRDKGIQAAAAVEGMHGWQ